MLQVATFTLPDQQQAANEFLASHKPDNVNFNKDMIVVFYDDGTTPACYQIAELREYLKSITNSRIQHEVAIAVMESECAQYKADLADLEEQRAQLTAKDKKKDWQKVADQIAYFQTKLRSTEAGIKDIQDTMQKQDVKAAFVEHRIAKLENTAHGDRA